jgi:hypothetical protein
MARPMRMLLFLVAALAALAVVPVAAAWGGGGGGGGTTANTFSGRATVLVVDALGVETTVVDTGEVSPSGGTLEAGAACYPGDPLDPACPIALPDVTGGLFSGAVLHASVVAQGNQSTAEASISEFGLIFGEGDLIAGEFAEAQATATCTNGVASVSGTTSITNLTVGGVTIAVNGAANQVVPLPGGGQIVINEQVGGASGNTGDLTVTALHIVIPGEIDLRIARAHADIRCGTTTPPKCPRKWTGHGGYKAPNGHKVSFAVAAAEDNQGWGHMYVAQKETGLKVSGDPASVSAYTRPGDLDASRVTIQGPAVSGRRFGGLSVGWMEIVVDLDAAGDRVKVVLLTAPRPAGGLVLHTLESVDRVSYGGVRVYT